MREKENSDFWLSPGISHPTGNKSDIKRERLAPNIYASHKYFSSDSFFA
jgi:hypothetical protein